MIQKIALLVGGLGAAAVLAFALGLTNFVFAGPSATKQTADTQPAAQAANSSNATADQSNGAANQGAQTRKVVDKVYIAPTAAPQTARANTTTPTTSSQPNHAARPKAPARNNGGGNWESDNGGSGGHGGDN